MINDMQQFRREIVDNVTVEVKKKFDGIEEALNDTRIRVDDQCSKIQHNDRRLEYIWRKFKLPKQLKASELIIIDFSFLRKLYL